MCKARGFQLIVDRGDTSGVMTHGMDPLTLANSMIRAIEHNPILKIAFMMIWQKKMGSGLGDSSDIASVMKDIIDGFRKT
jgi:hypothetical protein